MQSKYIINHKVLIIMMFVFVLVLAGSCKRIEVPSDMNIIFLHHSTGSIIWKGYPPSMVAKALGKVSDRLADQIGPKAQLTELMETHNREKNKNYLFDELTFPKASPYGWNNFPFDYYNIWVKNAGVERYMEEPTLEILTKKYNVIIFKHCFPVTGILPDTITPDINSDVKTLSNYKLQYTALRDKLHEFSETKFIVFTGASQVQSNVSEDKAIRSRDFFNWVINEWDQPEDNVFIWDLYNLQTRGGLYFREEYAVSPYDSHPNMDFAGKAGKLLFNRIIDVIESNGEKTSLTGELK